MLPFSAWILLVITRGPQMEIIKMMAMKSMVADWLNRMTSPGKPLHKPQRPHDKWLYLHLPQQGIKPFGFMDPTNRSFHKNWKPNTLQPQKYI